MMRPVPIGQLRHLVSIEQRTEGRAADGEVIASTWVEQSAPWANIVPVGGGEGEEADKAQATINYSMQLRYDSAIVPEQRVTHGSDTFAIVTVEHSNDRRWTFLGCTQEFAVGS